MHWLLPCLFVGCTGPESKIEEVFPTITVLPETLDFGEVVEDYTGTADLTIANGGPPILDVTSVAFTGEDADVFGPAIDPFELAKDESVTLTLTCTPPQQDTYSAVLVIESDDEEGAVEVPVTCTGVEAPTPDIDCDPLSIDFGTLVSGSVAMQYTTCCNVGDGPLNVGDVEQTGSGAFSVDVGAIESSTLAPDECAIVPVTYQPETDLGDNGSLFVNSDDPDEARVQIVLLGNGGGSYEYPVAVIDCPTSVQPRNTITLDGSGSYDPGGLALTEYEWTLVSVPEGSAITTRELVPETELAYLQTDVAGDYVVTLQVTNELDLKSVPAECVLEAIPDENFHVELSWNTGSADVDLHVISDGADMYATPEDCNWCNQNPEWGDAGATDNPTLDLDDWSGYGPENTNIDEPADGTYEVKVHYFDDHGDGDVVATVKIWLYGEEVANLSEVMGRNDVWDVASIEWPDGVVLEHDTALYGADLHTCQ
ncbi:MAG: choice-of-anchor D domain-containing protein [Myxococcota bacterium]